MICEMSFLQVNVVGFAHFWDTSINVVSTINIVLCIGLTVDYAAHIGHAFMVASGSKKSKTIMMESTCLCISLKINPQNIRLKGFKLNFRENERRAIWKRYQSREEINLEKF